MARQAVEHNMCPEWSTAAPFKCELARYNPVQVCVLFLLSVCKATYRMAAPASRVVLFQRNRWEVMSSLCVNNHLISFHKFVFQVVDVAPTLPVTEMKRAIIGQFV